MALLLDTNALLWYNQSSPLLTTTGRTAIDDAGEAVVISAATVWEISIKVQTGKLVLGQDIDAILARISLVGWTLLPIGVTEAKIAGGLPLHHRDPFDRMLVAQSQLYGLSIVSADKALDAYGVNRIW